MKHACRALTVHAITTAAVFQDFCGYSLGDLRGEMVGSIIEDADMKQRFKTIAEQLRNWKFNAAEFDTIIQSFEVRSSYGVCVVYRA